MENLLKIKAFSNKFHGLLSVLLLLVPLYYIVYWAFINHLPETLITVNTSSTSLIPDMLDVKLRMIGFSVSLLPLSTLTYLLFNIRKLFSFYKKGEIFSFEHVVLFKKTARGFIFWVISSILYGSAKSVLFSFGNPPGSRVLTVEFSSAEITEILVGAVIFLIAWVMDEGRALAEDYKLTV